MPNTLYPEKGAFLAMLAEAEGPDWKPSKAAIKIDELMPELSNDDLRKLYRWMLFEELRDASPEERREILSTMDTCPCCDRWLGHNRPPADDEDGDPSPHRRQSSFDF